MNIAKPIGAGWIFQRLLISSALLLSGCGAESVRYLTYQDGVVESGGDAVAANKAVTVVDPWPANSRNAHIPMEGHRAALAISRYETNNVIEPRGTGAQSMVVITNNGGGAPPSK